MKDIKEYLENQLKLSEELNTILKEIDLLDNKERELHYKENKAVIYISLIALTLIYHIKNDADIFLFYGTDFVWNVLVHCGKYIGNSDVWNCICSDDLALV